jgi:hypothetical protein
MATESSFVTEVRRIFGMKLTNAIIPTALREKIMAKATMISSREYPL